MDRVRSLRVASAVLFAHGFIEVMAVAMFFAPSEFLPAGFRAVFWTLLSVVYGLCRLVAGCAIWFSRKWGVAFGVVLSVVTMMVAPSVYPFGVMDLPLAAVVLAALLYAWLGGEKI
jgi:hypothetical protein